MIGAFLARFASAARASLLSEETHGRIAELKHTHRYTWGLSFLREREQD